MFSVRPQQKAAGTARKALADPNAYDLAALNEPQRRALIRFWEAWQEELKRLRILDLACGSGAILIKAFNQLHAVYELSNARLEELRGQRTLFDLDRQILQHKVSTAWTSTPRPPWAPGGSRDSVPHGFRAVSSKGAVNGAAIAGVNENVI